MRIKQGLVVDVRSPDVAHLSGQQWLVTVVMPRTKFIDGKAVNFRDKKQVFTTERPKLHSWIQVRIL